MSDNEDQGLGRVIEIKGLASIFISLFDDLRVRKFSRDSAIDIATDFMYTAMGYKVSADAMDQEPTETFIQFIPSGGDDHLPDCPNNPHSH